VAERGKRLLPSSALLRETERLGTSPAIGLGEAGTRGMFEVCGGDTGPSPECEFRVWRRPALLIAFTPLVIIMQLLPGEERLLQGSNAALPLIPDAMPGLLVQLTPQR
jgi:hypothetical protein